MDLPPFNLWLYSEENIPDRHWDRFTALRDTDLQTARAWAIKENLRFLWSYVRRGWALRHWKRWYFWATHCRLQPVIDVAKMLKRRLNGLLNFFAHPSPMQPARGSTPAFRRSSPQPAATATTSTSRPPSTSTAEGSSCTPLPTQFPDEPQK